MELISIRCLFELINDSELNESTWEFDLRINRMHTDMNNNFAISWILC